MAVRLAINGFGRIGRAAFKIAHALGRKISVVAVNDITDAATLAHLLTYDSVYGTYDQRVKAGEYGLIVGGKHYPLFSEKNPAKLPWKKFRVDVVIESTGRFRTKPLASQHLRAGARRVIISAPARSDDVPTFLMGVNHRKTKKKDIIISNASCTTNCIAPVAAIIESAFGIEKAAMTTIHSYTADQNLVDGPHRDLRRARAAAHNIVPTTTGAAIATTKTIPALAGLFDGLAVRVPTITGSLSDFTLLLKKKVTVEMVNDTLKQAAKQKLYKGIVAVTEQPIVSSDIIQNPHSAIVDLSLTKVIGGDLVKVIAWYDNEWGYANRLIEMALSIA